MGKKYLETKKDRLEASVLNVWQKAVEPTQEITDNAQMPKNPEENTQKEEVEIDEARQLKDPKKEVMVVKGNKVVVIDKKDEKKYLQKGYKLAEASGDKEAYTKFFNSALKKFKVNSPAELKGDAKKKFYDYVDKNWEGDNEKAEAAMAQVREFKIQGMKAALAAIWNVKEGKNPFKVENDKKVKSKDEKTMTGKKAAIIDLKPKIKD